MKIRQKVLILLFGLFLSSCGNQPLNSAAWQNPQIPKDEWIANGTTCEEYINFFNSVREREYLMVENDPKSVGYALEADESLIDTTFLMKGFADYEINGEITDRTSECLDFLTPVGFEFFEYGNEYRPPNVDKSWPISIKWFSQEEADADPNPDNIRGYVAYLNIHPKSKGCTDNVFAALSFLAVNQYGENIGRKTITAEVSGPIEPGETVIIRFNTIFEPDLPILEFISCFKNWEKNFHSQQPE